MLVKEKKKDESMEIEKEKQEENQNEQQEKSVPLIPEWCYFGDPLHLEIAYLLDPSC